MERIMVELFDGREVEAGNLYQFSNRCLMDSYTKALSEDRDADAEEFLHSILSRFEYDSCQKDGESKDEFFARQFSNFVNGKMQSPKDVAEKMAKDHRYLQSEMFKVCLEYITILAENADNGYYDGRNEWACKTAKKMVSNLK